MDRRSQWSRFKGNLYSNRQLGFSLDISRMNFELGYLANMQEKMERAYASMHALESGAIANPDEHRMVGHYWLRNSSLAPTAELRSAIDGTFRSIQTFCKRVHAGELTSSTGARFDTLLLIGIGGSALGPQFVSQALGGAGDPLRFFAFDNTDPDGMERILRSIPNLASTLVVVISKSGGTKETRNGQFIAKRALEIAGVEFPKSFVAVTGEGSELDRTAIGEKWLARFPMWDWVGGRTSELSAVGLLPAALQGFDIKVMLEGAAAMDVLTRSTKTAENPAALLALMWFHAGKGRGLKDMVVLPYKDRLELFSKYLQQLMMESLGKEFDLDGIKVNQGIAVYGNKGSTDQHAYIQQLRDGLNNFFAVFIEVLRDGCTQPGKGTLPASFNASTLEVEPGVTSGDYLSGFFLGTRRALHENDRESVTITIDEVSARTVGMLIALFERAVGLYASLVAVNAYHQPGVEAGKRAAAEVLALQAKVLQALQGADGVMTVEKLSLAVDAPDQNETIFKIVRHLAANARIAVVAGSTVFEDTYALK